jgi:hypothetical protein
MSNSLNLGFDIGSILGKARNQTKFHYLEEGTAVYKILPPFSAENKNLMAEHNFHWAKNDSEKNVKVQCTYYTEKYCPLCSQHKELEKQYKAAQASEREGSEVLKSLAAAMGQVQKTKQLYYNAVTPNNEVVVLQLSKTASDLLNRKLVEAIKEKNQDPTALNAGYWFKFTKQGKGRDSVTVDFHRTSKVVEGEEVEVLNRTPLPQELIDTLPTKVADIFNKKSMYINEYTCAELTDYLNGHALKDKFRKNQSDNFDSTKTAADAPSKQEIPDSEVKAATSKPSSAVEAFMAEAERLRGKAGNN